MKKHKYIILSIIVLCLFVVFVGTDKSIRNAKTIKTDSEIYSDFEINSAILSAKLYFVFNFKDCELLEITYAGDKANIDNDKNTIILTSSFKSGSDWQSTGLESDYTYTNWKFIMVRRLGFLWLHKDHGYV